MAEGLTKKKRIRAGHRGSATRMLTQVEGLLAASTTDVARLSQLKLSLQEKLETLKLLDGEIIDLIEEDHLVEEIEQADGFKEGIYSAMVKIDSQCSTAQAIPNPATSTLDTPHTPAASRGSRVRLPKLTLRTFNGDVTTWMTFWDSYESAVHNSDDLSDIDKFNYLRSLLERTAYEAISGLTLTSANYHEAIAILKKRFGNKQQIISKHMDVLLNVEPVTSQYNLSGLRHMYDLMESHIRSLKSLGVASESYGSLLSPVLLNKLPSELRLIVSREVSDEEWSLDAILKVIEEEIRARERTTVNPTRQQQQQQHRRGSDRGPHTAAALVSGAVSGPSCCYCQQSHSSSNCRVVTRVEARKQILKSSGRCYTCLRKGHIGRDCRSRSKCTRCNGRHHISICERDSQRESMQSSPISVPAAPTPQPDPPRTTPTFQSRGTGLNPDATVYTATPTASLYVDADKTVLLQTAQADIYDLQKPQASMRVRVILDTGSQRSYITNRAKNALSLTLEGTQCLSIVTFGAEKEGSKNCDVVRVAMKTREGPDMELVLFAVPTICEPLASQPISLCAERYDYLSQLRLADPSSNESQMEVDVLIGSDHYWELTTGEVLRGEHGGPVAINTKLGWVLSGPAPDMTPHPTSVKLISTHTITTHTLRVDSQHYNTEKLDDRLRAFWELESLGIHNPDKSVYEEFGENVCFKEGRYEVSLPWKEVHDPLPDNYQLSSRRLQGLLRRLRQDPAILKEYDSIIQDQIRKGIVEVVADVDPPGAERVHYLPHHVVIRRDKETTKLRIVYDASARSNGPSLNDCLYTGPKFDQKILDILLRFRSHKVALTADIEKAFLMISMAGEDRDVLRFLWVNDISLERPETVVLRFARVVFGVSSSPFLLNATLKCHMEKFASSHPELVRQLLQSIYVDDIVFGANSEDHAYDLYKESKDILRRGGFNLRKFATNSPGLQEKIDRTEKMPRAGALNSSEKDLDETYAKSTLGTEQSTYSGEHKILGVRWDALSDQLIFNLEDVAQMAKDLEPTKRHVVSVVGKFYDPLGFLSPVIVRFKILFQKLCESKVDWDQPLSGRLLEKWRCLIADLCESQPITVPRSYQAGVQREITSYRLCGFCDASVSAYAAVVYLVLKTDMGHVVKFVTSKSRVAPVQTQTIPRLELLSALLLARLMACVTQGLESELPLTQPTCYTDSKVALFWIQGSAKEWKPFVQNRVNEIRRLLPAHHWKHCPGKDNPADVPSRGLTPLELSINMLWRNAPDWLGADEPHAGIQEIPMPEECMAEMKARVRDSMHSLLVTKEPTGIGQILKCEDFSTLKRLLSVTAQLLKFARALKRRINPRSASYTDGEEIANAELLWIVESQRVLEKDRNFEYWKKQFDLFLDQDGVWRCRGRIQNADVPFATKHPTMLHRDHQLTKLIVRSAHERVLHNGVKETLTELRSRFWLVKGRSFVKLIVRQCTTCRRFEGKSYRAPPPPPLPTFRVKEEPPFTYTGVDFTGPLYTKDSEARKSKCWICLYTCCVVRAVHLDLVPDLSTPAFLRSLKRFAARRGLPRKIVSDNGKTFKAAAKIIQSVVRNKEVQKYMAGIGVEWVFNLPKAPWWGGVFERMVRSTKRCLKKIIGQAKLSYDELLTAITEVEMVINSRPLSYVSVDDCEEPLTPSHLLVGRRLMNLPDHISTGSQVDDDIEVDTNLLNRRARHLNKTLSNFWSRWRNEYLLELREGHRHNKGDTQAIPASIGDIVVVHGEKQPRGFWRLGKVEDLVTGRDGHVRGAKIRVASKGRGPTVLYRPIQRLFPLEVNCGIRGVEDPQLNSHVSAPSPATDEDAVSQDRNASPATQRPRRAAAREARDKIMACALSED